MCVCVWKREKEGETRTLQKNELQGKLASLPPLFTPAVPLTKFLEVLSPDPLISLPSPPPCECLVYLKSLPTPYFKPEVNIYYTGYRIRVLDHLQVINLIFATKKKPNPLFSLHVQRRKRLRKHHIYCRKSSVFEWLNCRHRTSVDELMPWLYNNDYLRGG